MNEESAIMEEMSSELGEIKTMIRNAERAARTLYVHVPRVFLLEGLELNDSGLIEFKLNKGRVIIKSITLKDRVGEKTEVEMKVTGNRKCEPEDVIYLAAMVVTAFRLTSEGGIGFNRELIGNKIKELDEIENYGLPYRPLKEFRRFYRTNGRKTKIIKKIIRKMDDIPELSQEGSLLRLALSRFNRSYEDNLIEDSLIDLVICFEVLYSSQDKYLYHFYRQSRNMPRNKDLIIDRMVFFLKNHHFFDLVLKGNSIPDLKKKVNAELRFRDNIMHGGKRWDKPTIKRWESLFLMRNYARFSLLYYLNDVFTYPRKSAIDVQHRLILDTIKNEYLERKELELFDKNKRIAEICAISCTRLPWQNGPPRVLGRNIRCT